MPNLRIIHDNAADRATLLASSTAGTMTVDRLQNDVKASVWRSVGTAAKITVTWTVAETIGGVFLPFCNLTSAATIRVRGHARAGDATPLFDTGTIDACPAPILGLWDWGAQSLCSNAYAYGGGAYGRAWIAVPGAVEKLVIDLDDPGNPAGYLEVGRLVCGGYWEPSHNPDYGAPLQSVDTSKHVRTDAGDIVTDIGTRYRTQSISLSTMNAIDRARLWSIVQGNGMRRALLLSLYPNHADAQLEQAHQVYGKLSSTAAITTPNYQRYATSIDIEEI